MLRVELLSVRALGRWAAPVLIGVMLAVPGEVLATGGSPPAGGRTGPHQAPAGAPRAVPGPEVLGLRTRTSSTYRSEVSGALVARIAGESVNYRDGQAWRAISNELVAADRSGYAVRNRANGYEALFPSDLSGEPIRVGRGSAWASFRLVGAKGPGVFSGSKASYADVLPGVSAKYLVDNDSVKEELEFTTAQTSSVSFELAIADGLTPRTTTSGVALKDASGATKLSFARPFLYDARGFRVPDSRLSTRLERAGSGWRMAMVIDADWLAEEVKQGPVVLDPVVNTAPAMDCFLDSKDGNRDNSFCSDPTFGVGYQGPEHDHSALLKFDVRAAIPAGSEIDRAWMFAFAASSYNSSAQQFGVHRVTSAWDNQATWNTRNGSDGWDEAGGGGDFVADPEDTSWLDGNTIGDWQRWTVTDMARGWMYGEYPNDGMLLRSMSRDASYDNFYELSSSEATSDHPYLEIGYQPPVGVKPFWTFAGKQQLSDRDSISVNVGSGNLVAQSGDVSIPGTGLSTERGRIYNSIPADMPSDLGSWKQTGGDARLYIVNQNAGHDTVSYRDESGASWQLTKQPDNTYRTPELAAIVREQSDGSFELEYTQSQLKLHFAASDYQYFGRVLEWAQDRNGNRISYTTPAGSTTSITDTQNRTTTLSYSPWGPLERITDPAGRLSQYAYGSSTELETYTDPAGKTMKYAYASPDYNVNDDLLQITDYENNKTKITYDAQHRVTAITRVTNPTTGTGDTTTFVYAQVIDDPCDPAVHVGRTIVTDPNGRATTYCYDAKLRVTRSKDALGGVRERAYDAASNVKEITSTAASTGTLGFNATFAFNGDSSLEKIEQGSGTTSKLTTSFAYDPAGNGGRYQPSSTTSPQGNRTLFGYDTRGNLTSSKLDQAGGSEATLNSYDAKGNPGSSTDPDGNVTTYGYDTLGNLTSITPPAGSGIGATTVTYDNLARVASVKDGKNQTRNYQYDLRDRVKKITFADGSSTTYTYDGNGNTIARADAPAAGLLGLTTILVDAKGRTVRETRPNGQATSYTYDGADNLKTLQDAGGTSSYTYGPTNLLTGVQEPGVATAASFQYSGDGNREKAILPNNVTVLSPYDPAGRLQSIKATNASGTVLQNLSYDYTKNSADTALLQKVTDLKATNTTTYTYDGLDRLDTAITTGTNPASYDYDLTAGGNRTRDVRKDPGQATATTTTYSHNTANQITAINGSAANLVYDANGNQTQSPVFGGIAVNARDQITQVTPPASALSSLVHAGPGQDDLVSSAGVTLQNDGLGVASKTNGSTSTYYARDNAGALISQRSGSTRRYFLTDERGSVTGLTDTAGTLTNTYKYDPYGRSLGTPHDTFGYAAGVRAPGGLTHFGARYYNPTHGTWTQQDPINQASDLRNANRYVYAAADPINQVDRDGEMPAPPGACSYGGRCLPARPPRSRAYRSYDSPNPNGLSIRDAAQCAIGGVAGFFTGGGKNAAIGCAAAVSSRRVG